MTPETEKTRDSRQNESQQPLDLGRLVAPVLQVGLEFYSFGPRSQIIKDLFREDPNIFSGITDHDGTTLPSVKDVLLFLALEERAGLKAA